MTRDDHDDDATIGEYLLGELDADEHAAFERRMAGDAALAARVERLRPAVAQLEGLPDAAWDAVVGVNGAGLPDAAERRAAPGRPEATGRPDAEDVPARPSPLDAASRPDASGQPDAPSRPAPPSAARPRRRRRLPALSLAGPRAWGLATAAAIALLWVGVAIGVAVSGGDDDAAPTVAQAPVVVLAPLDSSPAPARAEARMPRPDRMELTVQDLPPSPAGTYYEAWLLNDADDLVPVASFRVGADRRATVAVPLPAAADRYRYLDISLQRLDEGTGHSSQSVLRGALS